MCALRILIVDDQEFVRKSIRRLLSTRTDFFVCGEADDGVQAVERAKSLRPDVILMDVSMPRMNGTQATRSIRREVPESKVVIVSQNDPSIGSVQAREAGAVAFIPKSNLPEELIPILDSLLVRGRQHARATTSKRMPHLKRTDPSRVSTTTILFRLSRSFARKNYSVVQHVFPIMKARTGRW